MRYFRVNLDNNFVRDKDGNVVEAGFIYPACWDAHKVNVRAYKGKDGGGVEFCICETDNEEFIKSLLEDKGVTELTSINAESDIAVIRKKPDIRIDVSPSALLKDSAIKDKIKTLLDSKGIEYEMV